MMQRRDFIAGGAGVLSSLSFPSRLMAGDEKEECKAQETGNPCANRSKSYSCLHSISDISDMVYYADPPAILRSPRNKEFIKATGIEGFDQAIISDVVLPLQSHFGVNPRFGYYDEAQHGGILNAVAIYENEGKVLLGLKLVETFLKRNNGEYGVLAVCAHEYGHILQRNLAFETDHTQVLPCYTMELHADYLAGTFLGIYKTRSPSANFEEIGWIWKEWELSSCTHGSRDQREELIFAGYKQARQDATLTPQEFSDRGIKYLLSKFT